MAISPADLVRGWLSDRPDLLEHPLRGLARRVRWRLHFGLRPNEPLIVENWSGRLHIALPRSGSAAQIYYRTFSSSAAADVVMGLLRPGMVVLDVGAHIGEYTLLAAAAVGSLGAVHAFEPQLDCVQILRENARINSFSNISVHQCVVSDQRGCVPFATDSRSMGGWMVTSGQSVPGSSAVQSTTLDEFVSAAGIAETHLVKIDAAGAEDTVLRGGAQLFTGPHAPTVICKLYQPNVVRKRFGHDGQTILTMLFEWGYKVSLIKASDVSPVPEGSEVHSLLRNGEYSAALLCRRAKT